MAAPIRRLAQTVSSLSREALDQCVHIELRRVPKTTTPADIRRAITHARVQGVSDVALIYRGFRPTDRALLTLVHNSFLRPNLKALENLTIVGLPVQAEPVVPPPTDLDPPPRQRGGKGRAEAAERGIITGDGPHGRIPNNGKNVVVWGLPGRINHDVFRELLAGFKLAELDEGPDVLRIPLPDEENSSVSKWLIHMKSISEAHRLVRRLHLRHFQPERHGTDYTMRAAIVY